MQMELIPSGNNVVLNSTSSTFIVFLIELCTIFFFCFYAGLGWLCGCAVGV